jgi:predicted DNA binding protein
MTKIWFNRKNLVWFAYQDNEGQKFSNEYTIFLSSMQPLTFGDLSPMDKDENEIFDEVSEFSVDSILDKINKSGFNSLTEKEVEFLEKRAK